MGNNKYDLKEIIYNYYPRGIKFFHSSGQVNDDYINSPEANVLSESASSFYDRGEHHAKELIEIIKDGARDIELRDSTNIPMGDRCFSIQNSELIDFDLKKYYPLCFVFSGISDLYYYYFCDIDIEIEPQNSQLSYRWIRQNGRKPEAELDKKSLEITKIISGVIEKETNYRKISEHLVWDVIPDICNENIEMGLFTYFNALFQDDFYCLP